MFSTVKQCDAHHSYPLLMVDLHANLEQLARSGNGRDHDACACSSQRNVIYAKEDRISQCNVQWQSDMSTPVPTLSEHAAKGSVCCEHDRVAKGVEAMKDLQVHKSTWKLALRIHDTCTDQWRCTSPVQCKPLLRANGIWVQWVQRSIDKKDDVHNSTSSHTPSLLTISRSNNVMLALPVDVCMRTLSESNGKPV